MSNVAIKVNTLNRLKKIRSGIVYGNIETVLDELLQNCQRTFKVSNTENPVVDVVIGDDYIVIRDNGNGCADPQDIFEFEKSGWDIGDAFGQGGSESVFQIADVIKIGSQDWVATADVNKILEEGNLSIDMHTEDVTYLKGYEISLQGEKIAANIPLIKAYLSSTLKHYPYKCYINGELLEYESLQQVDAPFVQSFNNKFYSATLGIQRGWIDIDVYYELRRVTSKWMRGVKGVIELNPNIVDLKAPDRKSIIINNKYDALVKQLKEDCKELYLAFIAQAIEPDFEKYVDYIDEYLDAVDYIDYLPDFNKNSEQIRIEKLGEEVPNKSNIEYADKVVESVTEQSKGTYVPGDIIQLTPKPELDENNVAPVIKKKIKKFKDTLQKAVNTVWIEESMIMNYTESIQLVESYGIRVLYSKNKLYDKAYKYLKIPHIDDIIKRSKSSYIVKGHYSKQFDVSIPGRPSLRKEERLLNILGKIEEYYGLHDVFRIADVEEHILIQDETRTIIDTTAKTDMASVKQNKKIYLDRESLQLSKVKLDSSRASITKFDVLVILLNVNKIANGLSTILYNTIPGTVDHFNKSDKISKEIALMLASL